MDDARQEAAEAATVMRIVAVLEADVTSGGGFNQAVNAILQMARLCESRHDFSVLTSAAANVAYLQKLGVSSRTFTPGMGDRVVLARRSSRFVASLVSRLGITSGLERALRDASADIAYFVTPSGSPDAIDSINYFYTVWDACHRDFPEFPEVRTFSRFEARESLYKGVLTRAAIVFVDSADLRDRLRERYGLDRERILVMPFGTSPFLSTPGTVPVDEVLATYRLQAGYFFYPAQFWAHKNHVRVLEAMALLERRGIGARVVFAGGDPGGRAHVERYCRRLSLEGRVRFLGFVPPAHIRSLYEACTAVVMPTYFGPTNIPPLEAWLLGRPLIYSSHLSAQSGDAALLVDPDDAAELATAMEAVLRKDVADHLVERGYARARAIQEERVAAEADLLERVTRFASRRRCWA